MTSVMIALATIAAASSSSSDGASLPVGLELSTLSAIPLQHDGRWPPLDTVARDLVESVTGDPFSQGADPVLVLLAWTFDAPTWRRQPLISIDNAELRSELELPGSQEVFSFSELLDHRPLRILIESLARIEKGRKLDPLQSKAADINSRLLTLRDIFQGSVIRAIPDPTDVGAKWNTIPPNGISAAAPLVPVQKAWSDLKTAFLAEDNSAFAQAATALSTELAKLPAASRPGDKIIKTELRYNRLNPYRTAWQIMIVGAVLAALSMSIKRRWFDAIVLIAMIAGFAVLSYGMWLRWEIAGSIPASNMFESLLFLSWGMGVFAIVSMFVIRHRSVQLTASGMGAVALLLADCLPMDHFIRPVTPVLLDTIWMSIHVPVIMISYSVLALGVLMAHVQLVASAVVPGKFRLLKRLDSLHYWYIHVGSILLLAGIVTGSMWAASSWGRYWGWDPKEVWSLVALLGYLTILHVRIDHEKVPRWTRVVGVLFMTAVFVLVACKLRPMTGGKILGLAGTVVGMALLVAVRGPVASALKSILCFWLIIMTYVGVNYVLGSGLHSYGFGTGEMVYWMFLIGKIDLAFMAIFGVIYLVRRSPEKPSQTIRLPVLTAD